MIRYGGIACICASIFILGYRVGIEVACYQGSASALWEAAKLRYAYYWGIHP